MYTFFLVAYIGVVGIFVKIERIGLFWQMIATSFFT